MLCHPSIEMQRPQSASWIERLLLAESVIPTLCLEADFE